MTNAPFGAAASGPNPTDRAKQGVKRSLWTDGAGIPLAVVIDGANRHDMKLLVATLDGLGVTRPAADAAAPQHVCLDAGTTTRPAVMKQRRGPMTPISAVDTIGAPTAQRATRGLVVAAGDDRQAIVIEQERLDVE